MLAVKNALFLSAHCKILVRFGGKRHDECSKLLLLVNAQLMIFYSNQNPKNVDISEPSDGLHFLTGMRQQFNYLLT